ERFRRPRAQHHGDGRRACGAWHRRGRPDLARLRTLRIGLGRRCNRACRRAGPLLGTHAAAQGCAGVLPYRERARERTAAKRAAAAAATTAKAAPTAPPGCAAEAPLERAGEPSAL